MNDSCTESFDLLEVPIYILNMHNYILVDLIGTRRPELGALRAQHYRALSDRKLSMHDRAIGFRRPQALREAEGLA
jgi:hypothetical protein